MVETAVRPEMLLELQQKIAYAEKVKQITNRIHSAKDLDQILIDLKDEILGLFDTDKLTLYAVDVEKKEIYSKFVDVNVVKEIRVPISEQSIAGYVAKYRKTVNIADAYNAAELKSFSPSLSFDSSWDKKTGFRTKQVLAVPIVAEGKYLMGVIQLINKKGGPRFTPKDEESVVEISKILGIAFYNQWKLSRKAPTKFDGLISQNLITQAELEAAIADARKKETDVESILIEQYKVPKAEVGKSLSLFYKCPFVEYDEKLLIDPELIKHINFDYLKKNFWLPLKRDKDTIQVLVDDPHSLNKVEDIQRMFLGRKISFSVGLRKDISQFLMTATGKGSQGAAAGSAESISSIVGELVQEFEEEKPAEAGPDILDENDSAIVRLANQIIADAYKMGTSDIHVEPYSEKKETVIRFRVDGSCFLYQKIPAAYRKALVSRYKIMARLDIAERRKPQDGKIKFQIGEKEIELRVATIPTAGANEDVVMRILAASEPIPIDKLNMSERNLREIKKAADKPYGIILVVGPTGSGKTTTLHSVLGYINTPERKIWTAEDPVEITQYGLRQVQVQAKIGFTFAMAMRAFLRADPDVIMVGEMRDKETAETGIEASLTGHLVFSTLHTNSAVETVTRLLEMGMDPFNFSDALLAVLAQRLVKTICKGCKEQFHPSQEEFDDIVHGYGGEQAFAKLGVTYKDDFVLYRGKGCEACKNTGYKGRTGMHELLVGTDRIKKLIQRRAQTEEMLKCAQEEGMTTLLQDGIEKVLKGNTDYKQVKAVAIK